jgi:uncharacterized membrane protein
MNSPASTAIAAPRRVDAGNGYRWWADAFSWLFGDAARVGVWVGMWLLFLVVPLPLHLVPLGGSVISFLLSFVLSGGLMAAARSTQGGRTPVFADLFSGFGPKGGALVASALLILLACLGVIGLMLIVGLGAVISAIASAVAQGDMFEMGIGSFSITTGSVVLILLCFLLFIPISMAAWLAPALVVLRDASPGDALRLSLAACSRNAGALTVYGLSFIGLAIIASMLAMLGWLFLGPLLFLSTYAAYRDLFEDALVIDVAPGRPAGSSAA